jgi:hypothetical protein
MKPAPADSRKTAVAAMSLTVLTRPVGELEIIALIMSLGRLGERLDDGAGGQFRPAT